MKRSQAFRSIWPLIAAALLASCSVVRTIWAHADHVFAGGACEIEAIQPVDWLRVQRELARLDQAGQHTLPGDAATRGS